MQDTKKGYHLQENSTIDYMDNLWVLKDNSTLLNDIQNIQKDENLKDKSKSIITYIIVHYTHYPILASKVRTELKLPTNYTKYFNELIDVGYLRRLAKKGKANATYYQASSMPLSKEEWLMFDSPYFPKKLNISPQDNIPNRFRNFMFDEGYEPVGVSQEISEIYKDAYFEAHDRDFSFQRKIHFLNDLKYIFIEIYSATDGELDRSLVILSDFLKKSHKKFKNRASALTPKFLVSYIDTYISNGFRYLKDFK